MRGMMLGVIAITLTGAIAMSESAVAEEPKKDEPKTLTSAGITYDMKVTVKVWDVMGKKFLKPVPNVWAKRTDKKDDQGKPVIVNGEPVILFDVRGTAGNNTPSPNSVIIDKDGNEFTVIEGEKSCWVKLTKKAEPKKP